MTFSAEEYEVSVTLTNKVALFKKDGSEVVFLEFDLAQEIRNVVNDHEQSEQHDLEVGRCLATITVSLDHQDGELRCLGTSGHHGKHHCDNTYWGKTDGLLVLSEVLRNA